MSIFCKAENCPRAKDCIHAFSWKLHKRDFPNSNPVEGYASGVWYIDEQQCIKNNYKEGVFWKQT